MKPVRRDVITKSTDQSSACGVDSRFSLIKVLPAFMKSAYSLMSFQRMVTKRYPFPAESSLHTHILFIYIYFNIILPSKPKSLKWCFRFRLLQLKFCTNFSSLPHELHDPHTSSYIAQVQIFSEQHHSILEHIKLLSLRWQTKFHIHTIPVLYIVAVQIKQYCRPTVGNPIFALTSLNRVSTKLLWPVIAAFVESFVASSGSITA